MSFDSMWSALERVGLHARSGGYRRFAWTREDQELREWFNGECGRRGLDVMSDRMGNQWAWWGDPDAAVRQGNSGVAVGSHLDSVPDGGAFDGPLGVVSALAALDILVASGFRPSRPIAVVNFVDEEGARFGVACAGSRVITGQLDAHRALCLKDGGGVTMAEAMVRAGRDPALVGPDEEATRRVGTFIELHVEQGRALIEGNEPVGIGTDIWPHGRWRFDYPGAANHAGTTRLGDRADAMIPFAEGVLAARSLSEQLGCVATFGKVDVEPGAVNAIPAHVTGWLDARAPVEGKVRELVIDLTARAQAHGASITEESWTPPTHLDRDLGLRIQSVLGESIPRLGTGAGHDAGILSNHGVSAAMLFVRNPTGISHAPAEFAEPADCHAGVVALARVVEELGR